MSDPTDKKPDADLDLDWEDALADLENIEPAPAAPPPKAPSRALYRPPSADELERMKGGRSDVRETAPPPPRATPAVGLGTVSFDDDEEEDARTMVGVLSEHLRGGLSRSDPPPRATARPLAPKPPEVVREAEAPTRNSAVELDFDGLLDGLDSETSMYPAEVPKAIRASQPEIAVEPPAPAGPTSPPPARPASVHPPAVKEEAAKAEPARPVAPPLAAPRPPVRPPGLPGPGLPGPGLAGPGLPKPVAPPPLGARPGLPRPNVPPPAAGRVPLPGFPKPGVSPATTDPAKALPKPPLGRGASALAAAIAAKREGREGSSPMAAPVVPPPAVPAAPKAPAAEVDDLDDVLAALDQDIAPVASNAAGVSGTAKAEEDFFRGPPRPQAAPSLAEDLQDLADSVPPPVEPAAVVPAAVVPAAVPPALAPAPAFPAKRRRDDEPTRSVALGVTDALLDPAPRVEAKPASSPVVPPAITTTAPSEDVAMVVGGDDEEVMIVDGGDAADEEVSVGTGEVTVVADDDEPSISAEAESDEPEISASEDDDEPSLSASEDESDEDLEAEAEAIEAVEAPKADRGAIAARLSVRSRKPRKEHFPLVGRTAAHASARAEFLESLAAKAKGVHAARLWIAAAELRRSSEGVDALIERALSAAPADPTALRAARARAQTQGDKARLVSLFAREAEGKSRLAVLSQIALFELGERDAAAMRAADDRLGDTRHGGSVLLPLGSAPRASSADRERSLVRAAANTTDAALVSALRLVAAASATQRNDREALSALGELLGSEGVIVRARARVGDAALGSALSELGPTLGENGVVLGEAARRLAAVSALEAGRVEEALAASRAAVAAPFLRVRARAAALASNPDEEIEALTALAQKTGTTERAVSLARVAELRLERNELDLAEEALRAASLADPELAGPRVVRAQLSRLDPARAARTAAAPEPGAVLAAKAVYVGVAQERTALAVAAQEDDAPLAADVLGLDVAAGLNVSASEPVDPLLLALRRHAERIPLESRKGALLALSIEARSAGRDDEAAIAVEEARAAHPTDELLLAEVARFAQPSDAAVAWLESSTATSDGRRASELALRGARILETYSPEGGGLETLAAARRAAEADPRNDVAWLTLSRAAKATGDAVALAEAEEKLGELAPTDRESAAHYVRAALARAGDDTASAGALLRRAREKAPRDLVLFALSMRLGEGLDDVERAAHLEAALVDAPVPLKPALTLAAASSHEAMGSFADAARLLEADGSGYAVGAERTRRRVLAAAGRVSDVKAEWLARSRAGAPSAQVEALASLASLDTGEGGDLDAARTAYGALLEVDPKHLPALRWLERHAMVAGREDELASTEARLSASLDEPGDALAHLRLAVRLATTRPGAKGEDADALLLENEGRVRSDLWLARRWVAAARALGDANRTLVFERDLVQRTNRPLERASLALRAAETAERAGKDVNERAAILSEVADAALEHPVLHGELAKVFDLIGDTELRIGGWQRAGDASLVPATRASSYHRAGVLAEDDIGDEERALALYELAAESDVTYADVFTRAQRILERRGDVDRLNALLARRLDAGGDAAGLVDLHLAQAKLRENAGDRDAARAALRSALELAPEHPQALKRLAELSLEAKDHRSAADALIRLARVRKDREELRWVFFQLGDIYDLHIPDPKRAEAAWKRVLKLVPDDLPSMERLAALYLREGPREAAIGQLDELIKIEPDPDRAREHQLSLARVLEDHGDARRAEQILETARRAAPTELSTLKAMADLYTRQRAQPALAMHLNRAVADFRHALTTDLADTAAWLGLVEVLAWRRRSDAARVVASAGVAMGIVDVELAKLLDEGGGAPGLRATLADEGVEDALAPAAVTAPLRAVFRALGSALEKVSPFDPRTLRAEKLGPRDTVIRPLVQEVARDFAQPGQPPEDVEVWLAAGAPRICLPIQSSPAVLVIGKDLVSGTDEREKRFLIARALKIARAQLALAVRTPPAELAFLLAGLVLNADPNYQHGLDPAQAQDWARRVARTVPRRALEDNGPLLFEMAGAPEHDAARLPLAVAELGSRAALLATGSVPHALSALVKMVSESALPSDPSARAALLSRLPEAANLLVFAIADAHFEVRTRAGADRL